MREVRKRLTFPNVVSVVALFVALGGGAYAISLEKNSVKSKHIKDGQVRSRDLANDAVNSAKVDDGTLLGADFAAGQLPAGAQGPKGERGPSFGEGRQVPNMNDIPCDQEVPVGSQTVTVTDPSRIWVYGHGSLADSGSDATQFELWLRLRNASDTATLAVSTFVSVELVDDVHTLTAGGLMLSGDDPEVTTPAFVASPGTYTLQLVVVAGGVASCSAPLPDFGYNQAAGMGYVLLGNG